MSSCWVCRFFLNIRGDPRNYIKNN
jgi:hypothetical protein